MMLSLHGLVRCRCLRVMAMLAWLILVSTASSAAPMGTLSVLADVGPANAHSGMSMLHGGHSQQMPMTTHVDIADSTGMACCSGHVTHACGCHVTCSMALDQLAPGPFPLGMFVEATYARTSWPPAPSPNIAPPLRPPLGALAVETFEAKKWLREDRFSTISRPIVVLTTVRLKVEQKQLVSQVMRLSSVLVKLQGA